MKKGDHKRHKNPYHVKRKLKKDKDTLGRWAKYTYCIDCMVLGEGVEFLVWLN